MLSEITHVRSQTRDSKMVSNIAETSGAHKVDLLKVQIVCLHRVRTVPKRSCVIFMFPQRCARSFKEEEKEERRWRN